MEIEEIDRLQRVIARKGRQTPYADNCWSLIHYHVRCGPLEVFDSGGTIYVWCPKCRTLAQLQQVAQRVEVEEAEEAIA